MKILLVSQMYPGPADPDLGVFVRSLEEQLVARGHDGESLHFVTDQRDVVRAAMARTGFAHDELPIARGLQREGASS